MIGVWIQSTDAREAVESIRRAETRGVPAVWLTLGGANPDSAAVIAAAAMVTDRIKMGTSIIPTWPRHPVALAQQAIAIDQLAPGRFRLGIGPGGQGAMEQVFGVQWHTPLRQLREYLTVLKDLLQKGSVDFAGRQVTARVRMANGPIDVPVMASALREASYRLCGEAADGAISWMCPWDYLRDVALPAMRAGAATAGRPAPPLVVHVPVCLSEDRETVRATAREQVGRYGSIPGYQAMFAAAGFEDVSRGYSDALIDTLVVSGADKAIVERLGVILAEGAGEIIVHPLVVGADRGAYLDRVFDLVARAGVAA